MPLTAATFAAAGTPGDVNALVDVISGLVTAGAVLVSGVWAYYRFVKNRTYRPRLSVDMSGQWLVRDGNPLLLARVRVKNIGASVVTLLQEGTGLKISRVDAVGQSGRVNWHPGRVYVILAEHAWIEPGETVSDDVLLDLGVSAEEPLLLETRLVWRWAGGRENIVVFARKVLTSIDFPPHEEGAEDE